MSKPETTVVHCKREAFDIYIGRPSIWGNLFSHVDRSRAKYVVETREEAIEAYFEWILTQPKLLSKLESLRGKRLGCWCKPQSCHGDVLVELLK